LEEMMAERDIEVDCESVLNAGLTPTAMKCMTFLKNSL
jgi:hypothetical protein